MLKHVVMWTLKDTQDASQNALEMKTRLEALLPLIPQLKALEVGIDTGVNEMDIVLLTEFDNAEGLAVYAAHPEHQKVVGFIKSVAALRHCVDYHT